MLENMRGDRYRFLSIHFRNSIIPLMGAEFSAKDVQRVAHTDGVALKRIDEKISVWLRM